MGFQHRQSRGFTLVELLIVLVTVGVLAMVGVAMIGNRQSSAVRAMLDELEGDLTNVRNAAAATGRDMTIEAGPTPLLLAYGDGSLLNYVPPNSPVGTPGTDEIKATVTNLLSGLPADPTVTYSQSVAIPLRSLANDPIQSRARVVPVGSNDWTTAMTATSSGKINQAYTSVDPFKAGDILAGQVTDAQNLFQAVGSATPVQPTVSGSSQRFTTTFCIKVVGTSPSGGPMNGSPMGLIVVLANGATIYKFYNPGVLEGNGKWRKI